MIQPFPFFPLSVTPFYLSEPRLRQLRPLDLGTIMPSDFASASTPPPGGKRTSKRKVSAAELSPPLEMIAEKKIKGEGLEVRCGFSEKGRIVELIPDAILQAADDDALDHSVALKDPVAEYLASHLMMSKVLTPWAEEHRP